MNCTHQSLKQGKHRTADRALELMRFGDICSMSQIITHCPECGLNIENHRIVEVKTAAEYLREMGIRI